MQRGEIWFAETPSGARPVLVLTRDPVADRIGSVVVAALTRTERGVVSELRLTPDRDGVPTDCVINFDNLHTLPRGVFRGRVTKLGEARLAESCQVLIDATGC
jgi:mRNA interferase MazF